MAPGPVAPAFAVMPIGTRAASSARLGASQFQHRGAIGHRALAEDGVLQVFPALRPGGVGLLGARGVA